MGGCVTSGDSFGQNQEGDGPTGFEDIGAATIVGEDLGGRKIFDSSDAGFNALEINGAKEAVIGKEARIWQSACEASITIVVVNFFLNEDIGKRILGRDFNDFKFTGIVAEVDLNGVDGSLEPGNVDREGEDLL